MKIYISEDTSVQQVAQQVCHDEGAEAVAQQGIALAQRGVRREGELRREGVQIRDLTRRQVAQPHGNDLLPAQPIKVPRPCGPPVGLRDVAVRGISIP